MRSILRILAACALALCLIQPASAQVQCGIANSISFPADPSAFRVVQEFGSQSPRHQGRYHTGEDWYGGRGTSYGEHVRAIAAGRVTFSSPNGWGRDGGVIIVEHAFPDGSRAYSMYGHLTEATGVTFPAPLSCVREGEVLAAVGDVRPTPHFHLEIRTSRPDIPGAGYSWEHPVNEGLRRPSKFIRNWQAWFAESYRWRLDLADETGPAAPPVVLDDNSLILLDANRAIRASADGRLLWRVNLTRPAVGVAPIGDSAFVADADGGMQRINRDGTLGETWESGIALNGAPLVLADRLLFPTPNGIAALDREGRAVLWQLDDVGQVTRWHAVGDRIGVMTESGDMLTLGADGMVIDRALLREPGALSQSPAGDLIVYTQGGLWQIDDEGTWTLALDSAPPGGRRSAVALDADDRLFLFDGGAVYAYNRERAPLWTTPIAGVTGRGDLSIHDGVVLLTSSGGNIVALQAETGGLCNQTRIYGDARSKLWHALGADGTLRVYVADQVIGLDWDDFLLAC